MIEIEYRFLQETNLLRMSRLVDLDNRILD